MANNLVLGLVIGASLKGSFSAAFGKANKTIENLSNNLGKATQQNEKLGAKMAKWQERQVALHQKCNLPIFRAIRILANLLDVMSECRQ